MKKLTQYIEEKLHINKYKKYNYHPKDINELIDILEELIQERGEDANLNDIDISGMTSLRGVFMNCDCEARNIDISEWDVSNVTDMYGLFCGQDTFNCNLSSWDVSNVENMNSMFSGCYDFKGEGLDKWNVNDDCNILYMFEGCSSLKEYPTWYKNRGKRK